MNDSSSLETLRSIEDLLRSILRSQLRPVLEQELADPNRKKLYSITGKATAREAAKVTKMGKDTISRIWQRWAELGLLIKDGKTYRPVL